MNENIDEVVQLDLLSGVEFEPRFVGPNRARPILLPWKKQNLLQIFSLFNSRKRIWGFRVFKRRLGIQIGDFSPVRPAPLSGTACP
jgi:hypothetical protein